MPGLTSGNHGHTFLTPPPHTWTWNKHRNSYLSLLVRVRFSSFLHLLLLSPFLFPFVSSVQVAAAAAAAAAARACLDFLAAFPGRLDKLLSTPPCPCTPDCLPAWSPSTLSHRIASHRIVPHVARSLCLQCRNKLSQLALLHFTYYAATATAASAPTSHGRLSTPWHQPASPAAGTGPSWLRWPAGQPAAAHAAARACPRHHPTEHEPNPDCHQLAPVGRGHVPHERRRLGLHPAPRRA